MRPLFRTKPHGATPPGKEVPGFRRTIPPGGMFKIAEFTATLRITPSPLFCLSAQAPKTGLGRQMSNVAKPSHVILGTYLIP